MKDARRSLAAITLVAVAGGVAWIAMRSGGPPATTTATVTAPTTASAPAPANATAGVSASASDAPRSRTALAPVYVATEDGFEITFPSVAPPVIDRGEQETALGKVPVGTYYVTYGASAFSISVARHPHARVAASTPAALVRAMRDDIVKRTGAKLIGERPFEISSPGGAKHPGLYQELALPRGLRALHAIVFVCDVAYTLSAAGPAGDPSLDADLFGAFVASLRVTKSFGCAGGG